MGDRSTGVSGASQDTRADTDSVELSSNPRTAIQETLVAHLQNRLSSMESLGIDSKIIDTLPSERARQVVIEALCTSLSSVGTANIDHLISVFREVAVGLKNAQRSPLTPQQVDAAFLQTFFTDCFLKGRTGTEEDSPLFPLVKLSMRGPNDSDSRVPIENFSQFAATMKNVDLSLLPLKLKTLSYATEPQSNRNRVRIQRDNNTREFLLAGDKTIPAHFAGIFAHGLPAPEVIHALLSRAGYGHEEIQEILVAVYAHHASGFILRSFAQLGIEIDFGQLAKSGYIDEVSAEKLNALYRTGTEFYGRWGMALERLLESKVPLTIRQRENLVNNMKQHAQAIEDLPVYARWQLLGDDMGQFAPDALKKWLEIFRSLDGIESKESVSGAWLKYFTEIYARDRSAAQRFYEVVSDPFFRQRFPDLASWFDS